MALTVTLAQPIEIHFGVGCNHVPLGPTVEIVSLVTSRLVPTEDNSSLRQELREVRIGHRDVAEIIAALARSDNHQPSLDAEVLFGINVIGKFHDNKKIMEKYPDGMRVLIRDDCWQLDRWRQLVDIIAASRIIQLEAAA